MGASVVVGSSSGVVVVDVGVDVDCARSVARRRRRHRCSRRCRLAGRPLCHAERIVAEIERAQPCEQRERARQPTQTVAVELRDTAAVSRRIGDCARDSDDRNETNTPTNLEQLEADQPAELGRQHGETIRRQSQLAQRLQQQQQHLRRRRRWQRAVMTPPTMPMMPTTTTAAAAAAAHSRRRRRQRRRPSTPSTGSTRDASRLAWPCFAPWSSARDDVGIAATHANARAD